MAEIVGTVASVFTLLQSINATLKTVRTIRGAQREIQLIQEQVQLFQLVLGTVPTDEQSSFAQGIHPALQRSLSILSEIDKVLNQRLFHKKENGEWTWTTPGAWLRHKSTVIGLCDRLKETLTALQVSLSTETLQSVRRIEKATRVEIRQQLTPGSASPALNTFLIKADTLPPASIQLCKTRLSTALPTRLPQPAKKGARYDQSLYRRRLPSAQRPRPRPTSSFEVSSSFLPQLYTHSRHGPGLYCYWWSSVQDTSQTRCNSYELLYQSSPRKRVHVSLTLHIDRGTQCWDMLKYPGSKAMTRSRAQNDVLSGHMYSVISRVLMSQGPLQSDSLVVLSVGRSSGRGVLKADTITLSKVERASAPLAICAISKQIRHLNVPRFVEAELAPFQAAEETNTSLGMSFFNGRWVQDVRFGLHLEDIERRVYEIRALHILRGSSRINPIVGIITDVTGQLEIAKGFMTEACVNRSLLFLLHDAAKRGKPIRRERWLRWCRQTVEGVAITHSKGFVVGTLGGLFKAGVGLDNNDDVAIHHFEPVFSCTSLSSHTLPPEYQHVGSLNDLHFRALPETDVYQLGLFLWHMARCSRASPFHETLEPVEILASQAVDEYIDSDTPQYLRDAIVACRTKSPSFRPTAQEILDMFPEQTTTSDLEYQDQLITEDAPYLGASTGDITLECLNKAMRIKVACEFCNADCSLTSYRCRICQGDDFDMCPACFVKGTHCYDDSHYLYESGPNHDAERWFSSVRSGGHRENINHQLQILEG